MFENILDLLYEQILIILEKSQKFIIMNEQIKMFILKTLLI